jgi:hypothetical protein
MKWGIRRYQNPDGSLTKAGRKRYDKEVESLKEREKEIKRKERTKARIDKINAKRAELDAREDALHEKKKSADKETYKNKNKTFKDMTDEELINEANRMRLEQNYLLAKKQLSDATPQQVSTGEKFMKGLWNDVVRPAATNAGKAWLEKTLKDKLGVNEKDLDPLSKLKKKAEQARLNKEILENETKIKKLKNKDDTDDGDMPYEERTKKENYRKSVEDRESGKEALERARAIAKARYGDGDTESINRYVRRVAEDLGINFYEDDDD